MRTSTVCRLAFFVLIVLALPLRAETLVALTSDSKLRYFDSTAPGAWIKTVDITGLTSQHSPVAIDFRPDGSLVLIARNGTSFYPYEVNPVTGVAARSGIFVTASPGNFIGLDTFAKDVHQTDLSISFDDDSLHRISFDTAGGGLFLGTNPLAYDNNAGDGDPVDEHSGANPSIVALGSTNGFPGAKASVLYGVDSSQNSLVKIDWDTGSIDTVASIRTQGGVSVQIAARTGFDISGATGIAYVSVGSSTSDATTLHTLDLTTGLATNVGTIGPGFQQVGVNVVDITAPPSTPLVNISTRSKVGAGEDVLIAGFIAQGGATTRLIIRGIGPSLSVFGINNVLADPVLTIFDGNGAQIATNDNWKSNQQAEITQTGLAPTNDAEAAYVGNFAPGQYTAKVSGSNGGTGVGLVEIYKLADL